MDTVAIIIRVACLVFGYLFGMIQSAYIYGRIKGIDIREHGSGNAGTTNTLRVLGRQAGLIVFLCDLLKMVVPIAIMSLIIDKYFADYSYMQLLFRLYMGLGGIIGHNFPFYLGFKGGKGIAATSGMIIAFNWLFIPMGLITFFGTLLLTHYVSLSSLVLLVGFFTEMVIMCVTRFDAFSVINDAVAIEIIIVAFIISALGYIRHIANIKRLINHEERKTYIIKKKE